MDVGFSVATGLVILLNWIQNRRFFGTYDLQIYWMISQNNRATVLCYVKLCALFQTVLELQSENAQFGSKSTGFFVPCDLRQIAWRTTGHLFYTTSSFVHHFIAIYEFELELQSGNAQLWSKSMLFLSRATMKFDRWPSKTIGHHFYATSSFVHHFIAICEFKLELQSGSAQFGSKSAIFCPVLPWNLTDILEKQ